MNQKAITKLTEDIYKSAENRTKSFYKYQKENKDKLLLEIAKILLSYNIVDEYIKISDKDKKRLRAKLNKIINEYSNNYDEEIKDIENILSDSSRNKYSNLVILLGVIEKIRDTNNLNSKIINKIVNNKVDSKHWSDRLWNNKKGIEESLKKEIKNFLNGKTSVNKIERMIRDKYSIGASQTRRLVEYEVSRCQNEVNEYFFKVQGIIKVMYCADLDSRTCSDCSMHNGVIFYVNEDRPSLPRHCYCRCQYIPV
ncbi:minor capsid protein (plasmid) [Clostridioides difficile]|uniref:minor capsid protein n=1 Tax=Clostridioides difficile TaxID=1496 RepID=UPI000BB19767|nr:minor capsid protein [Clostridioides difficile]EII6834403.1 minor capsid protein [Clostridioides difficile]EIJ0739956.1 minor capsid protein [Clostridioides difficile]MBH7831704.1 minor capsid protein [Clostridioides difficile]MBH7998428.1 minor capsid protein [Clostridioides difficile]MBY1700590.1 minor capsid protein [Clostridioides difficile]